MSIPPDRATAQSPPQPDRVPPRNLRTRPDSPPDSTPWWRRTWVIAAAAFVAGAGISGATVRGIDTSQTRAIDTAPVCDAPNTIACAREGFGDGQYLVLEDILPGKYHTDAGGSCYYSRLRSDDPSAIIVKKKFDSPTILEVEPTDYAVLLSGGCVWELLG